MDISSRKRRWWMYYCGGPYKKLSRNLEDNGI
jgi:hypothetical protein